MKDDLGSKADRYDVDALLYESAVSRKLSE